MRLLFVSGTGVGGSGRSQRELAVRLARRGHEVTMLVDDGRPHRASRLAYEQFSDLSAKVGSRGAARPLRWVESLPGRSMRVEALDGVEQLWTPVPENAAQSVIERTRPDVVIGSSVLRLSWRKIRTLCESRRIATVLYVREAVALNHFTDGICPADKVVANSTSLADAVSAAGFDCEMVPSVIDLSVTRTVSTRHVALLINPIESHGIELVWPLAVALPHVNFVLQESWPLEPRVLDELEQRSRSLSNVEFRRARPPGPELYADARVLLVPHRIDNRPRVVAEAQDNGIPIIATNFPGLAEAVGDGGELLGPNDVEAWARAIEALWTDDSHFEEMSMRARAHGRRPDIRPDRVVDGFEAVLDGAVRVAAERYRNR